MKNQSILLLVAMLMLASCTGRYGVMKRRYTKGYYVSGQRNNHSIQKDQKQTLTKAAAPKKEVVPVVRVEAPAPEPGIAAVPSEVKAADAVKQPSKQTPPADVYASARPSDNAVFKPKDLSREVSNRGDSQKAKGNANAIVLIILCIVLPPLAVYLFHDAINKDFWLSLILTILFWVPGVIWAFLVCFAGVSIA